MLQAEWIIARYTFFISFPREAKLSPYAVSAHSHSSTQLKRPKSAILSGKGKSRGSADPITFQSTPQTVIGWADKADWTMTEQHPKQRTRPVSAPATRTRWKFSCWISSFFRPSSLLNYNLISFVIGKIFSSLHPWSFLYFLNMINA